MGFIVAGHTLFPYAVISSSQDRHRASSAAPVQCHFPGNILLIAAPECGVPVDIGVHRQPKR